MKLVSLLIVAQVFLPILPGIMAVPFYALVTHYNKFEHEEFRDQFLKECFYEVGDRYWGDNELGIYWRHVHLCGEITANSCNGGLCPNDPHMILKRGYKRLVKEREEDSKVCEACFFKFRQEPMHPACEGLIYSVKEATNMTLREKAKLAHFDMLMNHSEILPFITPESLEEAREKSKKTESALLYRRFRGDFSEKRLVSTCFGCHLQHHCPYCYGITWGYRFNYEQLLLKNQVEFTPRQNRYIDMYDQIVEEYDKVQHVFK